MAFIILGIEYSQSKSIKMETSNGIGKVIGALVVGALTGAALGILFAPDKGYRTRRHIMNGAKDLAEDVKNKIKKEVDDLRSKAEDLEGLIHGKKTEEPAK